MYAPRVFFSMIGALLVFAVATYFIHGSFYTAFIQTLICAVILQVGYFIGILVLVSREKRRMRETFSRDRNAETMTADTVKSAPPHGAKLTDM
ncbi:MULTISPECIES: exopolysaccharide production repressor protein [unclassified Agrobacterium]|uniref:Exopolysaccharide production repressor exox n=1 Tax=Agrobacterium fabrum TaxID=1176649 RepID=A0A2W5ETK3_9HYPH|nr:MULTISPECIES: exopolysaccharide production repressor protein [unclassified Agrobacterium]PZP46658.1 MAG: exopolysaccharide production repressor exox [Agrobacterium fabrum]MDH0615003.1 exopolysaccharide production repressor protein [Agrobacterium sp. GD03872]MDH0698543.1 exopolysaccharide production repressor protein [Agrobacterium sp. GD03871]MDH1060386.1 exopolysaccharide production repressor protein [Agrobacterium sp. GD03992]MDH2212302.1 exopolysaccharide production repressor protein [Ag